MIRTRLIPMTREAATNVSSRTDRAAPRVTRSTVGVESRPSITMPACGLLSVSEYTISSRTMPGIAMTTSVTREIALSTPLPR